MELRDKVVVITGAARGIGAALASRFADEAPAALVLADLEAPAGPAAELEGRGIRSIAVATDVSVEADIVRLAETATAVAGRIDLWCSNAAIQLPGGPEASDEAWDRSWRVNVLAHVYAARAVLPGMLARRDGYLLTTASAAGLLTMPNFAQYAVTKHAAIAFAEWIAATHGGDGIKVSCLCPLSVRTEMLRGALRDIDSPLDGDADRIPGAGRILSPEDVAEVTVEGLRAERFLIFPHPGVAASVLARATDHDAWLASFHPTPEV